MLIQKLEILILVVEFARYVLLHLNHGRIKIQVKELKELNSIQFIFDENSISYAENYLRKGSKVFCEGKLETRKWQDQTGNDRYSTEICVRTISKTVGLSRSETSGMDGSLGQNFL